jgi:hypothetical protein
LKSLFLKHPRHSRYTVGFAALMLLLVMCKFALQEPGSSAAGADAPCNCGFVARFIDGLAPLSTAPLFRLVGMTALVAFTIWFPARLRQFFLDGQKIGWWLPRTGHGAKEMSWKEAFELASIEVRSDPVSDDARDPPPSASRYDYVMEALSFLAAACLASAVLDFLLRPYVPAILLRDTDKGTTINAVVDITGSLTAYLAIVTAVLGLYVARFTIRAQVRSKSRQEWIDKVRQLIAGLVCRIEAGPPDDDANDCVSRRRLVQLELLLNPSEKDHRLLTMLISRQIFPRERLGLDNELKQQLAQMQHDLPKSARDLLLFVTQDRAGGAAIAPELIAAQAVRLSQAILKREWVRVTVTE